LTVDDSKFARYEFLECLHIITLVADCWYSAEFRILNLLYCLKIAKFPHHILRSHRGTTPLTPEPYQLNETLDPLSVVIHEKRSTDQFKLTMSSTSTIPTITEIIQSLSAGRIPLSSRFTNTPFLYCPGDPLWHYRFPTGTGV